VEIPFEWRQHLVTVPARLGEIETRVVFDSGIGVEVVRESLAGEAGVRATGETFTARRMSGEETTLPLAVASSVELGGVVQRDALVTLFDFAGMPAELDDVGGFVSLGFFADTPVTVDHPRRLLVLETPDSLAARRASAAVVPLELERQGLALDAHARLELPNGEEILVEVDTGSDDLILHERFLAAAGVDPDGPGVRRVAASDAWGEPYERLFAAVRGTVRLAAASHVAQVDPPAIFQRIRYDGLVGRALLHHHALTWDVARGELLVSR
jgi:hypothetical protein